MPHRRRVQEPARGYGVHDRPADRIRTPTARGQDSQPGQVVRGVAGPAMQQPLPPQRHLGGSPHGAGERSRDRGDRIGVAAAPDAADQRIADIRGARHRRQRALERLHDPTVVRLEVPRMRAGRQRFVDQVRPPFGRASDPLQPNGRIELARPDRVPNRQRPQDDGVDVVLFVVSQLCNPAGGFDQAGLEAVTQEAERHRPGTHQGAVAGTPPGPIMHLSRCPASRLLRVIAAEASEHRPGLGSDVLGGRRPVQPATHDRREGPRVEQRVAARQHLEDGHRHGGVVGPLPPLMPEHADAEHGQPIVAQPRSELVGGPERIPRRRRHDRTDRAIQLHRRQRRPRRAGSHNTLAHRPSPTFCSLSVQLSFHSRAQVRQFAQLSSKVRPWTPHDRRTGTAPARPLRTIRAPPSPWTPPL